VEFPTSRAQDSRQSVAFEQAAETVALHALELGRVWSQLVVKSATRQCEGGYLVGLVFEVACNLKQELGWKRLDLSFYCLPFLPVGGDVSGVGEGDKGGTGNVRVTTNT